MRYLASICMFAILLLATAAGAETVDWSQYLEKPGHAKPLVTTTPATPVKSQAKPAARPAKTVAATTNPRAKPKARRK